MASDILRVSIIVPVHNAEKTLDACVKSIIEQDYRNIECLLVENGSTDESIQVCRRYSDSKDGVRLLVSPRAGVSHARNLGLSEATGDIIGFCDADDLLEPGAIREVVNAFQENKDIVGVIGAFNVGYMTDAGIQKRYKGINKKYLSSEKAIALTVRCDSVMGSVWNKYYRADLAKNTLFDPDLAYCEDMHYNVKLLSALRDDTLAYTQKPLYCYMINPQSVTNTASRFYDENDELKYIVAMNKILSDCSLKKSALSLVRMKIAKFSIDYLYRGNNTDSQKNTLKQHLRQNFWYFFKYIVRFEFGANIKRMIKLLIISVR